MHLAAAEGHTDCVKLLVETCGVSPTMRDRWGFTPLVEAHRFQHRYVVLFLTAVMKEQFPKELEYSLKLVEKIKKSARRPSLSLAKEISMVKLEE